MTEDAGRRVRSGVDLFEIGTADAARVYPHQQLAAADFRYRNGFYADVILAAVHCGLHRGRNYPPRVAYRG